MSLKNFQPRPQLEFRDYNLSLFFAVFFFFFFFRSFSSWINYYFTISKTFNCSCGRTREKFRLPVNMNVVCFESGAYRILKNFSIQHSYFFKFFFTIFTLFCSYYFDFKICNINKLFFYYLYKIYLLAYTTFKITVVLVVGNKSLTSYMFYNMRKTYSFSWYWKKCS